LWSKKEKMEQLKGFGIVPFAKGALFNMLRTYKSPNDKVSALIENGDIISLKNGLYVVSEKHRSEKLIIELIANQIYGPSYVSLDSALAYYGLIPEKVSVVSSICSKRSRKFKNSLGHFYYFSAKPDYFEIGVNSISIDNRHHFLMASIEKAICDKIIFTQNLNIVSIKSMELFLVENLRFDFSGIQEFDFSIIEKCIECGIKTKALTLLLKYFKTII